MGNWRMGGVFETRDVLDQYHIYMGEKQELPLELPAIGRKREALLASGRR